MKIGKNLGKKPTFFKVFAPDFEKNFLTLEIVFQPKGILVRKVYLIAREFLWQPHNNTDFSIEKEIFITEALREKSAYSKFPTLKWDDATVDEFQSIIMDKNTLKGPYLIEEVRTNWKNMWTTVDGKQGRPRLQTRLETG